MSDIRYDFKTRVAVVTGGANGIGAEIARQYAEAGAAVCVWDRDTPQDPDPAYSFFRVDVSDLKSVQDACAETVARFGRIDFLSHNAGFAGSTVPVRNYDPNEWEQIVDVNLTGTFRVCQTIAPVMADQNFGRIINMASLAGKEGTPNASAYSAAKAGVIGFTKSLAKELAETDIRVNCIAPAAVKTAILEQMTPEFVQTMIDKSPMKRLGTPEEVATMVMWLSSHDCSFNSGAVFDLSGGRATY
ncbi:MAG: SDR family NAD(P)-dependent oxidoreductase [Hyphomicrobiales bacterium]